MRTSILVTFLGIVESTQWQVWPSTRESMINMVNSMGTGLAKSKDWLHNVHDIKQKLVSQSNSWVQHLHSPCQDTVSPKRARLPDVFFHQPATGARAIPLSSRNATWNCNPIPSFASCTDHCVRVVTGDDSCAGLNPWKLRNLKSCLASVCVDNYVVEGVPGCLDSRAGVVKQHDKPIPNTTQVLGAPDGLDVSDYYDPRRLQVWRLGLALEMRTWIELAKHHGAAWIMPIFLAILALCVVFPVLLFVAIVSITMAYDEKDVAVLDFKRPIWSIWGCAEDHTIELSNESHVVPVSWNGAAGRRLTASELQAEGFRRLTK